MGPKAGSVKKMMGAPGSKENTLILNECRPFHKGPDTCFFCYRGIAGRSYPVQGSCFSLLGGGPGGVLYNTEYANAHTATR